MGAQWRYRLVQHAIIFAWRCLYHQLIVASKKTLPMVFSQHACYPKIILFTEKITMRTARRYIYKQVLWAVLFVTLGFLALITFFDALGEVSFARRLPGVYGMINSALYVGLKVPGNAYELLPIAVLIACIFVMASFAQNSEFTILRTSGLGPWRALRSLLWLGAAFSVLTFIIGDYIAPQTEKMAQFHKAQFTGNVTVGRTGAWIKETAQAHNRIINVRQLTPEGTMQDVRIFDFDKNGFLTQLQHAQTATFQDNGWQLTQINNLHIQNAQDATQVAIQRNTQAHNVLKTDIQQSMVAAALLKPERMSTYELYRYISHLKSNNQLAQTYEIQFWRKLFYPFSCLVMVMLALPFAYLHFRSSHIATMVFIGVIAGISFFFLNNVSGHIGNLQGWKPWLAALLPSLIYMAISLFAFTWLVKNR